MAQLTIVFDGAIAVGPPDPGSGSREGPFFGIMPRSAYGLSDRTVRLQGQSEDNDSASPPVEKQYLAVHVPTIFTQMTPAADSRPPDQILQLSPLHDRWYIWHPVRERLEFRFDGSSKTGPLVYLRDAVSIDDHSRLPEGSLSFHAFQDVPHMEKIWPERSVLLPGLLAGGSGVSDKVMTQVLVPRGTVAGAALLDRPPSEDAEFDPPRAFKGQKLVPNTAVIVDAASVDIATFSLDTGQQLDSIKLEMDGGGEIWVSNGDPSDVEIDMEKLAMQIIQRLIEEKRWKPSKEGQKYLQSFKFFTKRFAQEYAEEYAQMFPQALDGTRDPIDDQVIAKFLVLAYHHSRDVVLQGLARDLRRRGEHDIDFELFYPLLREDHLADDGVGLPVPKSPRPSADPGGTRVEEQGPDCFGCGVKTDDRLFMRSSEV